MGKRKIMEGDGHYRRIESPNSSAIRKILVAKNHVEN